MATNAPYTLPVRPNQRRALRFGIGITGFVLDGFAPAMQPPLLDAYARFSPRGAVHAQSSCKMSVHMVEVL